MKSLLIKLGKVWKTIREDGLFSGGRRVVGFSMNFLKTILRKKKGDILIITGGVGDSARFRAKHYSEELTLHGFQCDYTIQDDPRLLQYTQKFKVFILHRVSYSEKIQKMIEEIKTQNKEIIFETDDLVFDAKLFQQTETYQQMNALEKKQYEKGIGEETLNDPYIKTCTTTTSYLAEKLKAYGKQVFVVSNKLSNNDLKTVDKISKNYKLKTKNKKLTIGYFRGSAGHDSDFAIITNPLLKILEKYPQVNLLIVGDLTLEKELEKYKDRIITSSYVPREKHFENISQCDIVLAPLVKNNPFCEAKSELKFFEAGILKVPVVAVRNQTFLEAISEGLDGFLAQDEDEWFAKLETLILDQDLRQKIGENAYQKTLANYTTKNGHSTEFYDYLKSKL